MAYLTFEQYQSMGGTMAEDDFAKAEPRAELLLDNWTLNRLRCGCIRSEWAKPVRVAMAALVDMVPGIEKARSSKAEGTEVTSFSNGVNSFGFGGGSSSTFAATSAEASAYVSVAAMLPVELVSACVDYNCAG